MRAHERTDTNESTLDNMPFWFRVLGWLLLPLVLALVVIAVTAPPSDQRASTSASKTDCLSRGGAWAKADAGFRCVKPLEEMK
jgi:hypothetical protein